MLAATSAVTVAMASAAAPVVLASPSALVLMYGVDCTENSTLPPAGIVMAPCRAGPVSMRVVGSSCHRPVVYASVSVNKKYYCSLHCIFTYRVENEEGKGSRLEARVLDDVVVVGPGEQDARVTLILVEERRGDVPVAGVSGGGLLLLLAGGGEVEEGGVRLLRGPVENKAGGEVHLRRVDGGRVKGKVEKRILGRRRRAGEDDVRAAVGHLDLDGGGGLVVRTQRERRIPVLNRVGEAGNELERRVGVEVLNPRRNQRRGANVHVHRGRLLRKGHVVADLREALGVDIREANKHVLDRVAAKEREDVHVRKKDSSRIFKLVVRKVAAQVGNVNRGVGLHLDAATERDLTRRKREEDRAKRHA